jgi:hypothetical protein
MQCLAMCNLNPQCRTAVYDSTSEHCQLYEGEISTGKIIWSNRKTSIVGGIIYSSTFYASYNKTGDQCQYNRYLRIDSSSNLCICPINTFWNGTMCLNQLYNGSSCISNEWCRTDLNLVCDATQHICGQSTQMTASPYQTIVTTFNNLMTSDVFSTTGTTTHIVSTAPTRVPLTVLATTTMPISLNYTNAYPAPVSSSNAAAQCESK